MNECADVSEVPVADLVSCRPPSMDAFFVCEIVVGEEEWEEAGMCGVGPDVKTVLSVDGTDIELWVLCKGHDPDDFISQM